MSAAAGVGAAGVGAAVDVWHADVVRRVRAGERFAGLYGRATGTGCVVAALLADEHGFEEVPVLVEPDADGELRYPSLTPQVPAAFWYERAAHDLSGVVPDGHPRLDPLLLHVDDGDHRPRPGHAAADGAPQATVGSTPPGPVDVHGRGMFTLPLGPVRSGVFESMEFLLESLGEDIPHLNIRPHFKHRGIAKQFEGRTPDDGVLVAERVEGITSVAHALAFSHAVERIAGVDVPPRAALVRVLHAELERVANHLDVAMRLADAAGLAVATARFGWHKEEAMRLVSDLCGSRFGRGVVVPGGVTGEPRLGPSDAAVRLRRLYERTRADLELAMSTPSFLDRLRGTGILTPERAVAWAALGPVGRASGIDDDNRWQRPTDAYPELLLPGRAPLRDAGDVQARAEDRWDEIAHACLLALEALERLGHGPHDAPAPGTTTARELRVETPLPAGEVSALGWAEGPQGEVLHALTLRDGRIARCFARSPSLHDLAIFHDVFNGDVFTDFAFIEASFGLGYAGVAM